MKTLKIVAISDTHALHNKMKHELPEGDVLVHAGDLTNVGETSDIASFNAFLHNQKHKYKYIVVIAGNHDWGFQRDFSLAKATLLAGFDFGDGVYYLHDEAVDIEGFKFYGSPWQPWFCNWAFNVQRGPALAAIWDQIPDDTDVLITHGPPHKILDRVAFTTERVGCEDLKRRIDNLNNLKAHIFGHIHVHGKGEFPIQKTTKGGIIYVNASICNEDYRPVNRPVVINITKDE